MPLSGEYAPSTFEQVRTQAETYERTGGADAGLYRGLPIIVLTSLGAKSGKLRKTPLMRVENNGEYVVVGSKEGSPENPVWCRNLLANPHAEIQDGETRRDYLARELTGDERALWWTRAVDAYPAFADFESQTTRLIPLFLLTPIEE